MAVLIYLIRHGETAYNAEQRYLGTLDLPLSQIGRDSLCQANFIPEVVYVSPLCRAIESAELLFPNARLQTVEDLREMEFGVFEGHNYAEMEQDTAYRAWVAGNCLDRCPGGESRAEFSERSCAAFSALVETALEQQAQYLVIVAHGGTQMAVLERYARPQRDYYAWCTPTGAGYVLSADDWHDTNYLYLVKEVQFTRAWI
jgi:alpha-ribazole phosphatase